MNLDLSPNAQLTTICKHFGECGGCEYQNFSKLEYQQFKNNLLQSVLDEYELANHNHGETRFIGPFKRRRIDFKAVLWVEGLQMGFCSKHSKNKINMTECKIVEPVIESFFAPLRIVFEQVLALRETVHIFMTLADNGLDVLIAGFRRELTANDSALFESLGKENDLCRLQVKVKKRYNLLYQRNKEETPYVVFGDARVGVSANSFLQVSKDTDILFADLLKKFVKPDKQKICDLFCGRGTLSIPLANMGHDVVGFEGDKHSIVALREASVPNLIVECRNLFDQPLSSKELDLFDLCVIDPPRAGAKAQCLELVGCEHLESIVYISCDVESFAKDSKILEEKFELIEMIPIDQFIWTPHLELFTFWKKKNIVH